MAPCRTWEGIRWFQEKDASIVVGSEGGYKMLRSSYRAPVAQTSSLSNPVKLAQEENAGVFSLMFAPTSLGPTLRYKPDRVAGSGGVDAAEG